EFVVALKIGRSYPYIGKSVAKAGLRHLKGLFLFQIERAGHLISPVAPDEKLLINDRLFFTGLPETIIELQKAPGLSIIKDPDIDLSDYDSDDLCHFEVVVSQNSHLVGTSVRESQFRSHYNAVIVAIHRSGERVRKKIGDIVFHAGDTLLIFAKHNFFDEWYHSRDFYLVSRAPFIPSKPKWYTWFSIVVMILMIVSLALEIVPILVSVSLAAAILVLSKCITPKEAQASVEWHVLLIIASAFGISKAMVNSGLAGFVADRFISAFGSYGPLGLLFSVYFITSVYTNIITNNATAALLFPITLSLAQQADLNLQPFCIAVAMASSASFATPIGYQTNLMVYGSGGYRFTDFLRIGIPMNLLTGAVAVALIYWWYF
ncbi:anion permease, partial [candidate division KSB1 bacterium]|nr:anion permease [candidate division KSB1 bacterium]